VCNMTQAVAVLSAVPRLSYHLRSRLPNLRISDVMPGNVASIAHGAIQPRPRCDPRARQIVPRAAVNPLGTSTCRIPTVTGATSHHFREGAARGSGKVRLGCVSARDSKQRRN